MKIFCHIPRENWIVDRMGQEFATHSKHDISFTSLDCDKIWLLASWCWKQIPVRVLAEKPVLCMIHHEVPEKFKDQRLIDFKSRDQFVDVYHTADRQTKELISCYTSKPVKLIQYWVNDDFWDRKKVLDNKISFKDDSAFKIGSFQRDTEGSDLVTPKLEKGPDLFCDFVEKFEHAKKHIILGGWRRQYVIRRLSTANINYTYFEKQSLERVREMYCNLDLYVVSSRYEGGPQAILECAALKVPIISRDVGIARDILPDACVNNDLLKCGIPSTKEIDAAFNSVMRYKISDQIKIYDNLLEFL